MSSGHSFTFCKNGVFLEQAVAAADLKTDARTLLALCECASSSSIVHQYCQAGQPVFAGGRVPIREVREVMEAGAEGSVRIGADHGDSSETSQQSLSVLLSESKADWLIQEQDLEIDIDERGRPIKLGSGSFGTVRLRALASSWGSHIIPVPGLC